MNNRNDRTPTDTSAIRRYFQTAKADRPTSPTRRTWLLAIPALASIPAIIAGSLGPWLYRETSVETDLLMGWQTDGLFTLIFAVVAAITIVVALVWQGHEALAWIGFGALALCAFIGLYDWNMYADMAEQHKAMWRLNEAEVRWGIDTLAISSPIGAVSAFFLARALNGD